MLVLNIGIILCLAVVGYCYLLYPFVIRQLAKWFPVASSYDETFTPTVSIILAVHNEEQVIEQCITSLRSLDYPANKIEIVIGSDGSTDRTNEIVGSLAQQYLSIKPYYFSEQRGKMSVLNELVEHSQNEILLFVDADVLLSPNTLRVQVRHFADPAIGAVSGSYEIHSPDRSALFQSEKEYASVEHRIREAESAFHSTTGLFGGNYSIRRSVREPLPDGLVHDDFFVVLSLLHKGLRVHYEPLSISSDLFARTRAEEFRRKSRSASRGYHTLSYFPRLVMPDAGRTAFLLWSHKIFRWLSPFLLVLAALMTAIGFFQFGGWFYTVIVSAYVLAAAATMVGLAAERYHRRIPVISELAWFVVMIGAYIEGTLKFLTGTDEAIWKSSTRAGRNNAFVSI